MKREIEDHLLDNIFRAIFKVPKANRLKRGLSFVMSEETNAKLMSLKLSGSMSRRVWGMDSERDFMFGMTVYFVEDLVARNHISVKKPFILVNPDFTTEVVQYEASG